MESDFSSYLTSFPTNIRRVSPSLGGGGGLGPSQDPRGYPSYGPGGMVFAIKAAWAIIWVLNPDPLQKSAVTPLGDDLGSISNGGNRKSSFGSLRTLILVNALGQCNSPKLFLNQGYDRTQRQHLYRLRLRSSINNNETFVFLYH